MEKVRRGFKTERGKQNHLKLYQIKHYLNNNLAENSGKSQKKLLTFFWGGVHYHQEANKGLLKEVIFIEV
jgi:hypothetical protein